jgi:predicted PurR-regulated permease PerM
LVAWALIVRTIALVVGLVLAALFVALTWELLVLILIAGILAAGMRPLVLRITRVALPPRGWHLPPVLIVLLLYLTVATVFGLLGAVLLPPLVGEVRGLTTQLPQYLAQIEATMNDLAAQHPWLPPIDLDVPTLVRQLAAPLQANLPGVFRFAVGVIEVVFSLFLVLVIALYLVLEGAGIRRFALSLMPAERRARAQVVLDTMMAKTGRWLLGQLALGFIIFVATATGLLILGAPYALLLAVISGVLEIVPMVGPIAAAIIAVTVSLFSSPVLALKVLLLYIVIQQLENNVLVPRVMSQTVGISPLTVLVALLVGGKLLGIVGALIAVPVAAALQVLVQALLEEDGLVERPRSPEGEGRPTEVR